MQTHPLMVKAADAAAEVVRGVGADQLDLPTPCDKLSVAKVINHLIVWSGYQSERSAHKELPDPALTDDSDFTGGDWKDICTTRLRGAVDAWGEPGAMEGTSYLGGNPYPAPTVALCMLTELVLHGWDIAVATGQRLAVAGDVAAATHQTMLQIAEPGRAIGIYGPPMPVPDSAPDLHKALALSGRDPSWQS